MGVRKMFLVNNFLDFLHNLQLFASELNLGLPQSKWLGPEVPFGPNLGVGMGHLTELETFIMNRAYFQSLQ